MIRGVTPMLPLADINAAVTFLTHRLGFQLRTRQPGHLTPPAETPHGMREFNVIHGPVQFTLGQSSRET
ncbi:hypothetical protein [Algicella marina]|uniref:Glyoxalase n=1 Tax=Algicella marina TaxID=2683284 RepID=A0A6P1T0X1_9RHOB|nr:hypothetical protein [Algicella marina]QHQ35293.1 hypothetical protein GO499_08825 [Algicella marina]